MPDVPLALALLVTLVVLVLAVTGTSAAYAALNTSDPRFYQESFSSSVFMADYSPDPTDGLRLAPLRRGIIGSAEQDLIVPGEDGR